MFLNIGEIIFMALMFGSFRCIDFKSHKNAIWFELDDRFKGELIFELWFLLVMWEDTRLFFFILREVISKHDRETFISVLDFFEVLYEFFVIGRTELTSHYYNNIMQFYLVDFKFGMLPSLFVS